MKLSLKYKLLSVFFLVVVAGISTFFFFSRKTFLEDKKLFVMDWSLTTQKASTSEIKLELKSRLDELQVLLPRIFSAPAKTPINSPQITLGLSERINSEILGITFYQAAGEKYAAFRKHENQKLLDTLGLSTTALTELETAHPLQFPTSEEKMDIRLINRSAALSGPQGTKEVPILTMMISGRLVNESSTETLIAIDLLQSFLQNTLKQSELANLFLIRKNGDLVSHATDAVLLQYSGKPFDHPIVTRLSTTNLPREAFEIEIASEPYLANLSASGIGDVYVVSQVKKSDAFKALSTLAWQSLQIGLIIISLSLIASVIFSSKLTENIKKLEAAARDIGAGNLNVKVNIKSGDEVERVASTFEWMTGKITSLLKETAEKARMEEELATASLIQNTILTPPKLNIEATEVVPYYKSASECGGDLWDAFVANDKLTVLLGDATGHGAPAAIVTAVVKSCVATLNRFSKTEDLTPSQILNRVNEIVYQSCKGELLMTMCVAQLDLSSGTLSVANAGHEAPLLVKSAQFTSEKSDGKKAKAEALFARGERLGFGAQSEYHSLTVQLEPGDTILVYSDGISEAHNEAGAMWGERNLKKTLASVGNMSLEQIKTSLIQAVDTFTQGTPQKDDITFVLFGWKKSKAQLNPLEASQAA